MMGYFLIIGIIAIAYFVFAYLASKEREDGIVDLSPWWPFYPSNCQANSKKYCVYGRVLAVAGIILSIAFYYVGNN